MKSIKRQLKMLLKLLCPHPGWAMNIFYSYNLFLDNQVYFWNGLAYLLFVAQTWKTTKNIKIPAIVKTRQDSWSPHLNLKAH